ncbi:polysaccharide biosynthesis protein [Alsobacter sp. R-9]
MSALTSLGRHKKAAVVLHDAVVTAAAFTSTFFLRFEGPILDERLPYLPWLVPPFVALAALVYWFFGLYQSRWRFASIPDLSNIVKAVTVLAVALLVLDYLLVAPTAYGGFFFGKIFIFLYWMVQIFALGGPRIVYRYARYMRSREQGARRGTSPALVVGRSAEAEIVLRAMEAGQIKRFHAVGILSTRDGDLGQTIRGVPVRAHVRRLEAVVADFVERGQSPRRLIVTPSALAPDAQPEVLLAASRRLGLSVMRFQTMDDTAAGDVAMAPVEIEDLLLRPTVETDRGRLDRLVRGRRVLVTGGGGSIGSELALRIAAFAAADLAIVENAEPALYQITEALTRLDTPTRVHGIIGDVRDRDRMHRVMAEFRPDLVFHAAALKHVPYLEQDWDEAIKTNVVGSVNVMDAAAAAGVRTMVMISTDKAIEPVSMLGATKRFAEMYAQALDARFAAEGKGDAPRFVSVRFGNVLGSNGSVVPKFKAQIAHGGPVTVTHPDMVRYFMTVREAAELVLTAASHADTDMRAAAAVEAGDRPSVYVLKMGQPVRILELAERMIRLAGFEPGTDIEIAFTGVRPGERMHEILFGKEEPTVETGVAGVMAAKPFFADADRMGAWIERLKRAVADHDRAAGEAVLAEAVPALSRDVPAPASAQSLPVSTPRVAANPA